MKKMTKGEKKVGKVMGEYKEGTLHSGKGGPVVKSRKQAADKWNEYVKEINHA